MSSSDYDTITTLNNTIVYLYKYVLLVFYLVSNVGSLLSLLVFSKRTWKKNVCVFYFKICLLVNLCYINCTVLGVIFISGFQNNFQNSSVVVCKLYFYASFVFATLSPTILILASIDRLLISSQNVDTRLYSSKRLAYFSISMGTVFWLVFNIHTLINVNIIEIYPSYFICYYDPSKVYLNFISYSTAVTNVCFSLLMIIMSIYAFKNVRHIRAIPREKRHQLRAMTKKDFQLLRCLFAKDVTWIIFAALVTIYYVYDAITKDQTQTILEQATRSFASNFLILLYHLSYSTSFFIFVIISKAFRHELKRTIYKIIGKDLVPIREEENRQENIGRDNAEINVVSIIQA